MVDDEQMDTYDGMKLPPLRWWHWPVALGLGVVFVAGLAVLLVAIVVTVTVQALCGKLK